MLHIGKTYHLTAQRNQDVHFHIRQYEKIGNSKTLYPTKRGIVLNLADWFL